MTVQYRGYERTSVYHYIRMHGQRNIKICLLFGIDYCGHNSATRIWLCHVFYSLCRRRKKVGKRGVILIKAQRCFVRHDDLGEDEV